MVSGGREAWFQAFPRGSVGRGRGSFRSSLERLDLEVAQILDLARGHGHVPEPGGIPSVAEPRCISQSRHEPFDPEPAVLIGCGPGADRGPPKDADLLRFRSRG